ncbi:hypothetical protein H8Z59_20290 [Mycolicibacterium fortuitum]|uniref:hypothetical protein n=1 Tax=Mycolicibacterium fortuitum TaxID=1766 RepID=UPI001CDBFEFE|nr:hypothetical protein [Mycolicibacterium fortuitum]UBV19659.1 hypothetical protein H8Z59_20290 [Mycolicibacterium fortuitum]
MRSPMKAARYAALAFSGAAAALLTSATAQADPNLTYREQQWIDKNGSAICEELAKNPTQSGLLSLVSSMVNYYEIGGSSGTLIAGSVAQQCPQYRYLIPALSGESR